METNLRIQEIILYKQSSIGKPLIWKALVEGNKVTYTYGQLGGKLQTKVDVYDTGMNIGKANYRSPEAQCELEVLAIAKKKVAKGYAPSMEEQGTKIPLPMLAKVYKDYKHKLTKMVHISAKMDGQRAIIDLKTGKLWSRTGKEITGVPHISKQAMELKLPPEIQFLDSEAYTHGISFEEMSSLVRPTVNIKKSANVMQAQVFDVISNLPYRERIKIVESIQAENIIPIKSFYVEASQVDEYHQKFVEAGYEGTMVRMDTESGYMIGKRTYELLKKKDFLDDEFRVIGFKHEENNPTLLGACFLITKDNVIFKATPAVPLKQKEYIWTHQDEFLGKLATVKFQNWSTGLDYETVSKEVKDFIKENPEFQYAVPGASPRFPVLQKFRSIDDIDVKPSIIKVVKVPVVKVQKEDSDMAAKNKKTINLECTEGGSSKFYRLIDNKNGEFTAEYGKIGAPNFQSAVYSIDLWDKKLNEKLKKGYVEV